MAIICYALTSNAQNSINTQNIQCEENGNYWNESWVSCNLSVNPNPFRGFTRWLLYEFHEIQYIESLHMQNTNRTEESSFEVYN